MKSKLQGSKSLQRVMWCPRQSILRREKFLYVAISPFLSDLNRALKVCVVISGAPLQIAAHYKIAEDGPAPGGLPTSVEDGDESRTEFLQGCPGLLKHTPALLERMGTLFLIHLKNAVPKQVVTSNLLPQPSRVFYCSKALFGLR